MAEIDPSSDSALSHAPRRRRLVRGLSWAVASVLLVSLAAWRTATWARGRALDDLRNVDTETMTLVLSNLRVELEKLEFLPQLVARDERIERLLQTPGDSALVADANRYLEEVNRTVGASDTYVMDVSGLTLAASNWSSDRSFVGEEFGFRPYFQDALEGLSGRYFARGATSLKRGYYFACPIHRDGEIAGVAAVKVGLQSFEQTWEALPVRIVLTDWHGIVFATNEPAWRYRTLLAIDPRTLDAIHGSRRYPGIQIDPKPLVAIEPIDGSTSLMSLLDASAADGPGARSTGVTYLARSQELPEYGWSVYTMSNLRFVAESAHAAGALGALSAGLLALTLFYFDQRRQHRLQRAQFLQRERDMLRRGRDDLERRIAERTEDLLRANRQLQEEIAEHQRAETALRETQQGLVQAGKLAALGQLAAGVTHELNQPLAALRSFADNTRLLIERERLDEARSNLDRILKLTERMAGLTQHLRTFARKTEPDQRLTFDVGRTVEAALALVGIGRSSGDLRLFHVAPKAPLRAVGDPIRLEQVLVNLIKNAREAIDGAERRELHVEYRESARSIAIEIRDSGPGIAPELVDRVFEPFFTTKKAGDGLGLGLSISSGILTEMGGEIRVRNHPDGGAVFTVELPSAESAERVRSA